MSKVPFLLYQAKKKKKKKTNVAVKHKIISNQIKVRLCFGHITCVHIHAKFEDLLNTSSVISNSSYEQVHQEYQLFGPRYILH